MSGRNRRGRRPPWDQPSASSSGQPRFGGAGQPNGSAPPRGYVGPSSGVPLGPPRWRGGASGQSPRWQGAPNGQTPRGQGGANAQAPRRPDGGKFGRGRPANSGGPGAQSAPAGGRWSPGRAANGGAGAYSQPPRWGRGGRPSRPMPRDDQDTRRPQAPNVPAGGEIDPFELFCAYHLGITAS